MVVLLQAELRAVDAAVQQYSDVVEFVTQLVPGKAVAEPHQEGLPDPPNANSGVHQLGVRCSTR